MKHDQNYSSMALGPLAILIIGFILVLIAPWVLTRYSGFATFIGTGDIGDTIGGTTTPIVGLISAILVYYAFLAQIKANKIVQEQIQKQEHESNLNKNFSNISTLISRLETEINSFYKEVVQYSSGQRIAFSSPNDKPRQAYVLTLKGAAAISSVLGEIAYRTQDSNLKQVLSDPSTAEIYLLLTFFEECIEKINTTELSENDKKIALFLVKQSFLSKIEPAFIQVLSQGTNLKALRKSLFVKKRNQIKKLLSIK